MAKKVRDAMTVEPRSAEPGLSLAEAAKLMKSEDVGSLPVVDDGHLVAVLMDRDNRGPCGRRGRGRGAGAHGAPSGASTAGGRGDRLVGIVAQADVARAVKAKQAGEVVDEISKPTGVES